MWLDSTLPPGLIAQPDGTPIMEADKVPDDFMILPTGVCHIEFAHSVCVCPEPVLANDRILFPKREGKPEERSTQDAFGLADCPGGSREMGSHKGYSTSPQH